MRHTTNAVDMLRHAHTFFQIPPVPYIPVDDVVPPELTAMAAAANHLKSLYREAFARNGDGDMDFHEAMGYAANLINEYRLDMRSMSLRDATREATRTFLSHIYRVRADVLDLAVAESLVRQTIAHYCMVIASKGGTL